MGYIDILDNLKEETVDLKKRKDTGCIHVRSIRAQILELAKMNMEASIEMFNEVIAHEKVSCVSEVATPSPVPREERPRIYKCSECGAQFIPKDLRAKCCSMICSRRRKARKDREYSENRWASMRKS